MVCRVQVPFNSPLGIWEKGMLIWDILERTAVLVPDHIAVVTDEQEVTYRRLAMDVDRLAAGFCALGLQPGGQDRFVASKRHCARHGISRRKPCLIDCCPLAPRCAAFIVWFVFVSGLSPKALVTDQTLLATLPEASLKQIEIVVLTAGQAPGSTDYAHLMGLEPNDSPKGNQFAARIPSHCSFSAPARPDAPKGLRTHKLGLWNAPSTSSRH